MKYFHDKYNELFKKKLKNNGIVYYAENLKFDSDCLILT